MSSPTTTIPTKPGKIFNVDDVTGKEHSALETTAAQAQIEAPNRVEAMHVSENAEQAQYVANQAASVAKTLGSGFTGEPTTAAGQFKGDAAKVTDAAVAEGKHDVGQAKAVGAGYVEQAKALANSAIETAQNYLPTTLGGKTGDPAASITDPNAPPLTTRAKDAAINAYATTAAAVAPVVNAAAGATTAATETAKPYVQSAANTAQNTLGSAQQTAQPHVENAKATAQNALGTASVPNAPSKVEDKQPIPAISAPLESGPYTVKNLYPTTTSTEPKATDIASTRN